MIRGVFAVPGAHIAVSNQPNEDAYVALANAFRAARRQVLDHAELQRLFVKPPAGSYTGFVASKL